MNKKLSKSTKPPSREDAKKQISENYDCFLKMSFDRWQKGKAALLHNGALIEVLDTKADAYKMGIALYAHPGLFSVQEIAPEPVDLGFMSYALRAS